MKEHHIKQQPIQGMMGFSGGATGSLVGGAGAGSAGWEILMMTSNDKTDSYWNGTTADQNMGNPGSSTFINLTEAGTGANNRSQHGDGEGLYTAFFNQVSISKIALCCGTFSGDLEPGNFSKYIVYDLVATTPSNKSMYQIIQDLDTFNRTNPNWSNNVGDSLYGSDSVTNFVGGTAKSGSRTATSGDFLARGGNSPDSFCIWGVNRDSDNDTQVLCAYSGNLQTGKADAWRGVNPQESFWSYWGHDFHSNSQTQTIGNSRQSPPGLNVDSGVATSAGGANVDMYLMAYSAP